MKNKKKEEWILISDLTHTYERCDLCGKIPLVYKRIDGKIYCNFPEGPNHFLEESKNDKIRDTRTN